MCISVLLGVSLGSVRVRLLGCKVSAYVVVLKIAKFPLSGIGLFGIPTNSV